LSRSGSVFHIGLGFAPSGQLVDVVPFADQEPLWSGALDPLDVRAAHQVDAARGFDRLVDFRHPLLVVNVLVGHVDFSDVIRRRQLGLRMKALDGKAADARADERGQYHRGVCLHQFDLIVG
jgi:hypothetical protein